MQILKRLPLLTGLLLSLIPLTAKASFDPSYYPDQYSFVTAYNLTGRMADGVPAHYGAVACKQTLMLGTRVHLDGLGDFVCEDRFGDENLRAMFDIAMPGASLTNCYAITGFYNWWILS